ncbi:hypothetical protein SAY86_031089 [Trapa natans]|uniref:F-box domain-containing protein n=1 Tax=Trapa natans TaxID=22666 RepID=A0AAN7LYU3_TRANT|nr:hypothetical protein SAY86_031089 [Trapa natans]
MSAIEIPQDILTEILLRLPVKSLVRFRSVSGSWNSLITSQRFVTLHLKRSVESGNSFILHRNCLMSFSGKHHWHNSNTVYSDDVESLTKGHAVDFPMDKKYCNYRDVGACNGLICFSHHSAVDSTNSPEHIVLWNPSIRTCFLVPSWRLSSEWENYICTFGFGFDSYSNQFKVVKLSYSALQILHCSSAPKVEIFVLGTNEWRTVNTYVPFVIQKHSSRVYIHGAVHWIGQRSSDQARVIVVFDVHEEVFREFEIPSGIVQRGAELALRVYRDSLCLSKILSGDLSIWVMKEYGVKESWTKKLSIHNIDSRGFNLLLGFRKCGRMLFVKDFKNLVSYDPEEENCTVIDHIQWWPPVVGFLAAFHLVESLVLLDGADGHEVQTES